MPSPAKPVTESGWKRRAILELSERRACQITGQHRFTQRHQPRRGADRDDALRERLRRLSAEHPRWGYRLALGAVRHEGWAVNRKKIQRLWREEGLRVPQPRYVLFTARPLRVENV